MSDRTYQNPERAPEYALHRHFAGLLAGGDTGDIDNPDRGILMQDYDDAAVQVVPSAGANPAISVLFWGEGAGKFIAEHTALEFAAKGAGVAWETRVAAKGRRMFVYISSGVGVGEECHIYVSGFRPDQV